MSEKTNDGATPEQEANQSECPGANDGRRFKHTWHWVWQGSEWTDNVRCATCGEVRTNLGVQSAKP